MVVWRSIGVWYCSWHTEKAYYTIAYAKAAGHERARLFQKLQVDSSTEASAATKRQMRSQTTQHWAACLSLSLGQMDDREVQREGRQNWVHLFKFCYSSDLKCSPKSQVVRGEAFPRHQDLKDTNCLWVSSKGWQDAPTAACFGRWASCSPWAAFLHPTISAWIHKATVHLFSCKLCVPRILQEPINESLQNY